MLENKSGFIELTAIDELIPWGLGDSVEHKYFKTKIQVVHIVSINESTSEYCGCEITLTSGYMSYIKESYELVSMMLNHI